MQPGGREHSRNAPPSASPDDFIVGRRGPKYFFLRRCPPAPPRQGRRRRAAAVIFFSEKKTFYLDFRHPFRGESNPPGRHQAPTRKRRGGRPPRKEAARVPPQYFPPAAGMEEAGVPLRDFSWPPQREADGDCPPNLPLRADGQSAEVWSPASRLSGEPGEKRTQDEPKTDPKWPQRKTPPPTKN